VKTPFGESHISESAGSYKIDIDARKGSLVRFGPSGGQDKPMLMISLSPLTIEIPLAVQRFPAM